MVTDSISLLLSIQDDKEFAEQSHHFGLAMVELFSNLAHMQTVLPSIGESLNLVRKGVAKNETVGQGRTLCCSHISLMLALYS